MKRTILWALLIGITANTFPAVSFAAAGDFFLRAGTVSSPLSRFFSSGVSPVEAVSRAIDESHPLAARFTGNETRRRIDDRVSQRILPGSRIGQNPAGSTAQGRIEYRYRYFNEPSTAGIFRQQTPAGTTAAFYLLLFFVLLSLSNLPRGMEKLRAGKLQNPVEIPAGFFI